MKRSIKKMLVALMAFTMIFTSLRLPAKASGLEGRTADARLAYANEAWSLQYWGGDAENGIVAKNATITGDGTYTVGLDFTKTETGSSAGIAFAAVQIPEGQAMFPNAVITVKEIKINDQVVEYGKGYTSSDDQKELRSNIYNAWVSELPTDARRADGDLEGATPTPVAAEAFSDVKTIDVTFEITGIDTVAYIAYADNAWATQYWGSDAAGVKATNATVTGDGQYTVGLEFDAPAADCAFSALMVNNLEATVEGAVISIDELKINGEAVEVGKYYTSSDDGIVTRVNLYNAWVSEAPEDARRADKDLEGATPTPVDASKLTNVSSIFVTFTVSGATPKAYLAYADSAWSTQYWGTDENGVKPVNAVITGEGEYVVGLDFDTPAADCAFAALMIDAGEKILPGWFYDITKIEINGEAVEVGKYYTSSDDEVVTRDNIYNEWVSDVPADARRSDGDLEGATPTPVSKDKFTNVSSIRVYFNAVWGAKPVKSEVVADIDYDYQGTYHAYLGCQTNTELWIFRNPWSDATYGGATNPEVFAGLYDTTNNISHPGTFTDVEITGDGTYTVSLKGADFANEQHMSQLLVSTDMPYASKISFTDIAVKINGTTKFTAEEGHISKDDKKADHYLAFFVQNDWDDKVKDLFAIQFPVTDIEITFTVSGMGYEAEQAAPVEETVTSVSTSETSVSVDATSSTVSVSETAEAASAGVPVWVWIVVVAAVVCCVVVVIVVNKKKTAK